MFWSNLCHTGIIRLLCLNSVISDAFVYSDFINGKLVYSDIRQIALIRPSLGCGAWSFN